MRARNIKPSFFNNEELVELPPLTRLFFIGLWCAADRDGRLKDAPRKLKLMIIPGDDCDPERMLSDLHDRKLIQRYEVDGGRYIEIPKFRKHQNPHHKEAKSEIPPPLSNTPTLTQNYDSEPFTTEEHQPRRVLAPTQVGADPRLAPTQASASTNLGECRPALNPESGFLNPESKNTPPPRDPINYQTPIPTPPAVTPPQSLIDVEKPRESKVPKNAPESLQTHSEPKMTSDTPDPIACRLAQKFVHFSTLRRSGGMPQLNPIDVAPIMANLMACGVSESRIEAEIERPLGQRDRTEWPSQFSRRLLDEIKPRAPPRREQEPKKSKAQEASERRRNQTGR